MAKPTASEIRDYLEGYCETDNIVSDEWIEGRRDNLVIPICERITRRSFSSVETLVEYRSGNGGNILRLNRRPITSLVSVEYVTAPDSFVEIGLTNFILLADEGEIKARASESVLSSSSVFFPKGEKNIKVTFTAGFTDAALPGIVKEAIMALTAEKTLAFLAGRGGGGDISVQGYSKSYGKQGKYTNIRSELARIGLSLLKSYQTSVVGD